MSFKLTFCVYNFFPAAVNGMELILRPFIAYLTSKFIVVNLSMVKIEIFRNS